MNLKIIITLIGILLICSCINNLDNDKLWIRKQLTQCAEEWQTPNSDTEGIKNFFKNKGLIIYNIKLEQLPPQIHCQACTCLSDTVLHLEISERDLNYFLEKGFR